MLSIASATIARISADNFLVFSTTIDQNLSDNLLENSRDKRVSQMDYWPS